MKKEIKFLIDKIVWRLLKHSRIFWFWYYGFLNDLMFDLELMDIEGKEITKKYKEKLEKAKNNCPTFIL